MLPSSQPPSFLRRTLLFPVLMMTLLGLTGCLTFETIITVNPDGSGTVEQTFILTNEMLRMALLFGDSDGDPVEMCDEADLTAEAASMGEGVRFVSAEAIDDGEALGCRARFAFEDVNTLLVNVNPEDQMPSGMTDDAPDTETPADEAETADQVTFRFEPGNPSTLVVMMDQEPMMTDDEETPDGDPFTPDSTQRAQQMQMMQELFKGARLAILLDVEGSITETNASFHEDSRVTLMEIDFDKLLEDEVYLEMVADANPQNADEMKALMQNVDGIKMETNEEVTIRFK